MSQKYHKRIAPIVLAVFAVAICGLLLTSPAGSDDRDLFRKSSARPYVFILFDNTGSMADDLSGSDTALEDDDSTSKLFLAKQALNDVLEGVNEVNFGFATFPDQDRHYVDFKNGGGTWVTNRNTGPGSVNCTGWEPNNDRNQDLSEGYTFKWPNTTNARGLQIGDIVPLDGGDNNVQRIRERLAPNLAIGESVPDYGIARYFRDSDTPGTDYRALRDGRARPFIAGGLTPLAGALNSFRFWFQDWLPEAEIKDEALAAGCKEIFVILMTDGFETCGGNGVAAAATLASAGVRTYVVGFAVTNPALDAIAIAGGTDNPNDPAHNAFFAGNQDELVDQLNEILSEIQRDSRSFATAGVPSVVGTAAENLYLTSFSPVDEGDSLWPGRLDAWRKPVTTAPNPNDISQQVPDRRERCTGPDDEACLAWDAGEEILAQAPTQAQVDGGNYKLGNNGANRRRVFYGRLRRDDEVPARRRLFNPPGNLNAQKELYGPSGMGFDLPDEMVPAEVTAFVDAGTKVIADTLKIKTALIEKPAPETGTEIKSYVIADIIHSDPQVLAEPERFRYFSTDLEGELEPCETDDPARYPCFVKRHRNRRRVAFVGSNEGQLHAIDAGLPERDADTGAVTYNAGSGKEIFAFVPRLVLPQMREMSDGSGQQYTLDGPPVVDDVLIDPINEVTDPPDENDREWRTVLIGGQREGGRAYYALDVTQPDEYDGDGLPTSTNHVPDCVTGGGDCGPLRYPSILWEGTDDRDEDDNDAPDLGYSWSKVNTGRIRVKEGTKTVDKYVAIFGGGMDPDFKRTPFDDMGNLNPYMGNFLYMVDIETGNIIYKRRLDVLPSSAPSSPVPLDAPNGTVIPGSTPSEPAAVDIDFDSYLDVIYIGTTGGYLYKVDLGEPMQLVSTTINDYAQDDPVTGAPPLPVITERIIAPEWEPFPILDVNCAVGAPCNRPIYFPPSVVFVNELSSFALALGTGDREDITLDGTPDGRFFAFVDEEFTATTPGLPLDETDFQTFDRGNVEGGTCTDNVLFTPNAGFRRGWVFDLDDDERLLNKAFAISGILSFTTFIPTSAIGDGGTCGAEGFSRLYGLRLACANAIPDPPGPPGPEDPVLAEVDDFVTQPFIDSGQSECDPTDPNCNESICSDQNALRDSLMDQFPQECTFTNYSLELQTLLSSTGLQCVVPIPVCVIERNWKEF